MSLLTIVELLLSGNSWSVNIVLYNLVQQAVATNGLQERFIKCNKHPARMYYEKKKLNTPIGKDH